MSWAPVALELGALALAVLVLAWDLAVPVKRPDARRLGLYILAGGGLSALLAASFTLPAAGSFGPAYVQDPLALIVKRVMLAAVLLAVVGLSPYARRRGVADRTGEAIVLLLFAAIGAMALVSAREWVTLFVAFELVSLPLYVLTALEKERRTSIEGAFKIFLFGSASAAVLLLGIALAVAASGTTFWTRAAWTPGDPVASLAIALILAGFGFKIAAFPFSLWVPDAYQGAPAPVVAFLSVAPKAAAVAALFRLASEVLLPAGVSAKTWLAVLAAASMVVGNLLALRQSDLKRLLAYSGIAQIGYVLAALAAGTSLSAGFALFFFLAYLLGNGGAFLVVAALEIAGEEPTLHGCRALIRRAPVLAGSLVVFLLSLGGIPFVLGFWGKLWVFLAAAQAGLWWLVALGAILAVVALYYYLDIVRHVLIVRDDAPAIATSPPLLATIVFAAVLLTIGGVVPGALAEPCLRAGEALFSPPRVTVSQSR
jgi:NADH-quinone oxidoreductase subunit N